MTGWWLMMDDGWLTLDGRADIDQKLAQAQAQALVFASCLPGLVVANQSL